MDRDELASEVRSMRARATGGMAADVETLLNNIRRTATAAIGALGEISVDEAWGVINREAMEFLAQHVNPGLQPIELAPPRKWLLVYDGGLLGVDPEDVPTYTVARNMNGMWFEVNHRRIDTPTHFTYLPRSIHAGRET